MTTTTKKEKQKKIRVVHNPPMSWLRNKMLGKESPKTTDTPQTPFEEEKLKHWRSTRNLVFTSGIEIDGSPVIDMGAKETHDEELILSFLREQREMMRKEIDNRISALLSAFANTPIKDRKDAFSYLVECRPKLLSLLSNKEI